MNNKPAPVPMQSPQRIWAVRALVLSQAFADMGVHEQGWNRGDQVEFWQKLAGGTPGQPWCMYFFYAMHLKSWCIGNGLLTGATDHANRNIMLANAKRFSTETDITRTGSCQEFWDAQKVLGRTHDVLFNPLPGDAVLFDWGKGIHHIERVKKVLPNGHLLTIGGNTPADAGSDQGEGDGVYEKERTRHSVAGFVHFI